MEPETSGIVNPPVHVPAVLNILRRDPSAQTLAFVRRLLPKLEQFLDYLIRERDPDGNGLVYVRHPWENGMDNSPTWDAVLNNMTVTPCHNHSEPLGDLPSGCDVLPYERADLGPGVDPRDRPSNTTYDRFIALLTCARNHSYNESRIAAPGGCPFIVEDIFFNVLVAQAADAMAALVSELRARGEAQPLSSVEKWVAVANRTRAAIGTTLWAPEIGMFASRDQRTGQLLPERTIGAMAPLMLDVASASASSLPATSATLRREALLSALRSPSFALPFRTPTLDANSSSFSSRLYWRGPTWFNTDWLLLRGLETSQDTRGDATALRRAMYALINATGSSDAPFREYWDPWTGDAHGTSGFSWTAALFLDTFCAATDQAPDAEDAPPTPADEGTHDELDGESGNAGPAEGEIREASVPSPTLPLIGIFGAVLAWGTFTVPMKAPAVTRAHLDPAIFQLYMCVGIALSSLLLLAVPGVQWQWTWWAAASAALWVPGSLMSVLAVKHLGIAVAQGVWSGAIALFSFLWGQLFSQMHNPALGSLGLVLLVGGIACLAWVSTKQKQRPSTRLLPPEVTLVSMGVISDAAPAEATPATQPPDKQLLASSGVLPAASFTRGLGCALLVGLLNGTVFVPLRLAPEHPYRDGIHSLDFAVCFGPASLVAILLYLALHAGLFRSLPALHARTCLLPGVCSGVLWSVGNACATLAVLEPFGLTVGYPSTQACLLVGGLWGIFLYGEMRGWRAIAAFFAAACVLLAGSSLLAIYGTANTSVSERPWWQTGVIYQVYPRSFYDSDGDGIGDLRGVTQKLPYLAAIGVDIVWLSPIYPSPMADFGYDISNYTDISAEYGTMADFEALLSEAHRLGLRVLLDFVPNHTSEQHPWFLESRSATNSAKRDWYVWADPVSGAPPNNWQSNFGGSAWELDEATGQFYYHAFLAEQPDLNYRNPEVVAAMQDVLDFWLARGVDGFRVDAVPFLFESTELWRDEPEHRAWDDLSSYKYTQNVPPIHELCAQLMETVQKHGSEIFFLGEAYAPLAEISAYYGSESRPQFSMPFNFFLLMNGSEYRPSVIADVVQAYSAAIPSWGWSNYVLSNHDNPRIATKAQPLTH